MVVRLFRAMYVTCCFNVCLLNIVGILDNTKFSSYIYFVPERHEFGCGIIILSFLSFSLTLIICPSSKIGGCLKEFLLM